MNAAINTNFRRVVVLFVFSLFVCSFSVSLEAKNKSSQVWFKSQLSGYSMFPTIKSGEVIVYKKVDASVIKKGDIIVYRDNHSGEQVCHRVEGIEDGYIRAKGDNNRFRDRGLISNKNLLGRVTHVNGQSV